MLGGGGGNGAVLMFTFGLKAVATCQEGRLQSLTQIWVGRVKVKGVHFVPNAAGLNLDALSFQS